MSTSTIAHIVLLGALIMVASSSAQQLPTENMIPGAHAHMAHGYAMHKVGVDHLYRKSLHPIFSFTTSNRTFEFDTDDFRWIPNELAMTPVRECLITTASDTGSTSSGFSLLTSVGESFGAGRSAEVDIGVEKGGVGIGTQVSFGAQFGKSSFVSDFVGATASSFKQTWAAEYRLEAYDLEWKDEPTVDALTTEFVEDAKDLDNQFSIRRAENFLNKYGTHYYNDVAFGATLSTSLQFTASESASTISSTTQNAKSGGFQFMFFKAQGEQVSNTDTNTELSVSSSATRTSVRSVGGADFETESSFCTSALRAPIPTRGGLRTIWSLLIRAGASKDTADMYRDYATSKIVANLQNEATIPECVWRECPPGSRCTGAGCALEEDGNFVVLEEKINALSIGPVNDVIFPASSPLLVQVATDNLEADYYLTVSDENQRHFVQIELNHRLAAEECPYAGSNVCIPGVTVKVDGAQQSQCGSSTVCSTVFNIYVADPCIVVELATRYLLPNPFRPQEFTTSTEICIGQTKSDFHQLNGYYQNELSVQSAIEFEVVAHTNDRVAGPVDILSARRPALTTSSSPTAYNLNLFSGSEATQDSLPLESLRFVVHGDPTLEVEVTLQQFETSRGAVSIAYEVPVLDLSNCASIVIVATNATIDYASIVEFPMYNASTPTEYSTEHLGAMVLLGGGQFCEDDPEQEDFHVNPIELQELYLPVGSYEVRMYHVQSERQAELADEFPQVEDFRHALLARTQFNVEPDTPTPAPTPPVIPPAPVPEPHFVTIFVGSEVCDGDECANTHMYIRIDGDATEHRCPSTSGGSSCLWENMNVENECVDVHVFEEGSTTYDRFLGSVFGVCVGQPKTTGIEGTVVVLYDPDTAPSDDSVCVGQTGETDGMAQDFYFDVSANEHAFTITEIRFLAVRARENIELEIYHYEDGSFLDGGSTTLAYSGSIDNIEAGDLVSVMLDTSIMVPARSTRGIFLDIEDSGDQVFQITYSSGDEGDVHFYDGVMSVHVGRALDGENTETAVTFNGAICYTS